MAERQGGGYGLSVALNHAVDAKPARPEQRPVYRPLPRKQVSRARRVRVDVPVLSDMVAYAAEERKRRGSLQAFLVASLCTIARPDSVVDISVAPDREQWHAGSPILDLNPFGRAQTRKYRPIVSVLPVLRQWLAAELAEYERVGAGHLVNSHGRSVFDVDRAWSSMLSGRKLPTGPEWKPYLLRHSLATILRNRGGTRWDLQGFMGHDVRGSTEVYAVGRFGTIVRTLEDNLGEIETRSQGLCAECAPNSGYPAIIKGRSK